MRPAGEARTISEEAEGSIGDVHRREKKIRQEALDDIRQAYKMPQRAPRLLASRYA